MGIDRKRVAHLLKPAPTKASPVPKSRYRSESEANYAARLEAMRRTGEILAWLYEPMSLRIGERCNYRPDFLVIRQGPTTEDTTIFEFVEIKGRHRFREKGIVKFRAAEGLYPWFTWKLIEA